MNQDVENEPVDTGPGLNGMIVILFKHKWKILLSLAAGLVAIAAFYFISPPPYESQAKLLVRYVLDRSALDSLDAQVKTPGLSSLNDNLILSEMEILTSWDLVEQVAGAVSGGKSPNGPKATAKATPKTKEDLAGDILLGLRVEAARGSNVILVSYRNRDSALAVQVLQELVTRYFVKHLEVHRSASAFDYVTQESDQVQARLRQIDEDLKRLKAKAGIVALPDSMAALNAEMIKSREELLAAEADMAEQRARVESIKGWAVEPAADEPRNEPGQASVNREIAQQYQVQTIQIARLQQARLDLLSRFTPESRVLKTNQGQIENLEGRLRDMEKKYPELASMPAATAPAQNNRPDLRYELSRLAALQGKTEALKSQLAGFKEEAALLAEVGPQIEQLEQKKAVESANYKYYQGSLEKARIDEALDPSKMPNISVVQKPSPAMPAIGDLKKMALRLAGGSLLLGLALAFLTELGLDKTVKRPIELEGMRIPWMLSIPDTTRNGHRKLLHARNGATLATTNGRKPAPWDEGHFIRPFCESLRDRLMLYFQLRNMNHKPKLVAVTSCSGGAGTSTLAGGLAAALSETGEGKVLLVDMNAGHEEIHPFFEGHHVTSLSDIIQPGSKASSVDDNLYLAKGGSGNPGTMQIVPKKFYEMIPRLKASDFDFIIFDMPALGRTSLTLAMAGCMDKVLLVVESERSNRNVVRQNFKELSSVKANVSTVLNKSRTYGPKWLQSEV